MHRTCINCCHQSDPSDMHLRQENKPRQPEKKWAIPELAIQAHIKHPSSSHLQCRIKEFGSRSTMPHGTHEKKAKSGDLPYKIQLFRSASWLDFYDFFLVQSWLSAEHSGKRCGRNSSGFVCVHFAFWIVCFFYLYLFDAGLLCRCGFVHCCNATDICETLRYFVAIVCI